MQVASQTCHNTLTLLDVERSRKVTDDSVIYILKFTKLKSLGIFHTSLTNVGKADIIFGLNDLEELPRGDFLCDALEDVNESKPSIVARTRLKIKGFWASEDYYFHNTEQLDLVAMVCPEIERMLFMFNNQEALFRDIVTFNNLRVGYSDY